MDWQLSSFKGIICKCPNKLVRPILSLPQEVIASHSSVKQPRLSQCRAPVLHLWYILYFYQSPEIYTCILIQPTNRRTNHITSLSEAITVSSRPNAQTQWTCVEEKNLGKKRRKYDWGGVRRWGCVERTWSSQEWNKQWAVKQSRSFKSEEDDGSL